MCEVLQKEQTLLKSAVFTGFRRCRRCRRRRRRRLELFLPSPVPRSPPLPHSPCHTLPLFFVHMAFVRIALAGAGSFAEVNIVEGDTISRLAKRACAEFPSWKADSAQLFLYLVAAGGDEEPAEKAISAVLSSGGRLGVGWSLTRAGISSGAWLVARASSSASAASKKFILVVNGEDEYGELVPKSLDITISTLDELKDVKYDNGKGNLVLEGTTTPIRKVEEILNGGTYTLVNGQQQTLRRRLEWTQQADRALDLMATDAVRSAVTGELGELEQRNNIILKNSLGKEYEFDGLLINTRTAIAIEAKHAAVEKHVTLVLDKASFLMQLACENTGDFKGITSVVPVLASSLFTPSMLRACEANGVSIVKPNGYGHTYFPSAPPPHLSGRRGFHTLARALRVLF